MRGELRELEERAAGIEQHADALARAQFAGRLVLLAGGLRATLGDPADLAVQFRGQRAHGALVVAVFLGVRIDPRRKPGHGALAKVAGLSDNHTIMPKRKASP